MRLVGALALILLAATVSGCVGPAAGPVVVNNQAPEQLALQLNGCNGTVAMHAVPTPHAYGYLPFGYFTRDLAEVFERGTQTRTGYSVMVSFLLVCDDANGLGRQGFFAAGPYIHKPAILEQDGTSIVDVHVLYAGATHPLLEQQIIEGRAELLSPDSVGSSAQFTPIQIPHQGDTESIVKAQRVEAQQANATLPEGSISVTAAGGTHSPYSPEDLKPGEWRTRFWQPDENGTYVVEFDYTDQYLSTGGITCKYEGYPHIFAEAFQRPDGCGKAFVDGVPVDIGGTIVDLDFAVTATYYPGVVV